MTQFPANLDTFVNPQAGQAMDAPGVEHDVQHANANDAIAAIQAKLGKTGSAVTTSVDYQLRRIYNGPKLRVSAAGAIQLLCADDNSWHELIVVKLGDQYSIDVDQTPLS